MTVPVCKLARSGAKRGPAHGFRGWFPTPLLAVRAGLNFRVRNGSGCCPCPMTGPHLHFPRYNLKIGRVGRSQQPFWTPLCREVPLSFPHVSHRRIELEGIVDTAAIYSVVPRRIHEELGIKPVKRSKVQGIRGIRRKGPGRGWD